LRAILIVDQAQGAGERLAKQHLKVSDRRPSSFGIMGKALTHWPPGRPENSDVRLQGAPGLMLCLCGYTSLSLSFFILK
jgi:hypothetical protein